MKSLLPLLLVVALLAHCSTPATIDIGSVRPDEVINPLHGRQRERCVRIFISETFSKRDTLENGFMLSNAAKTDRLWKDLCSEPQMKPSMLLTMDSPIYVAFLEESGNVLCMAVSDSMSNTFHIADGSLKNGKYKLTPGAFKWSPIRDGKKVQAISKGRSIYYGVPAAQTIRFLRGILDTRASAEKNLMR